MIHPEGEPDAPSIDPFVDAYEEAQSRDGRANLADFLPPPGHRLYSDVLCELVRVDLEYGWMRGCPRALEEYRSEFPDLFVDPDRSGQVAFEEGRLRRQAGERAVADAPSPSPPRPDLGEAARFYQQARRRGPAAGEAMASYPGPRDQSDLFRTLHSADPEAAGRLADALADFPEPGSDFAGFRLVRELGRGAFGRVYLARQGDLADRPVALKVTAELPGEAQTLAQLQHTHVVPIYSAHRVGHHRAVCMPFFGATTLADVLRDLKGRAARPDSGAAIVESLGGPGPAGSGGTHGPAAPAPPSTAALQALRGLGYVQAVLWIGSRLADGLAHAHERGIVHRDLKPANVLLTDDGQPMLLDFNLAADTKLDGAAAASVGGTLPYMAPEALEALRSGPGPADPRCDLYSLGVILFELATGRHPFPIRPGAVDAILPAMIADRRGPPPRLREANPAVSPAAEAIVRRLLEPDPARRYGNARELLEDLERQLEDRPLRHAAEPSVRERARKWARRHPRLTSTTALGAVAAVLIAGVVAGYAHRQRGFGPVEAAHALRLLADDHEAAHVLLLDPAGTGRAEGIEACRRGLGRFGVLGSPAWLDEAPARHLPGGDRAELRGKAADLLLRWAGALAREAAALAPGPRAGLAREAGRLNALAEAALGEGEAPRALWAQRATLARLVGDPAGAAEAERRAARLPAPSLREQALLALEDPDRTPTAGGLAALAEASRREPRDFPLWMAMGQCYALNGRADAAEDCFTVAIILRPNSPWPYFHRGRAELERGEWEDARADFERAVGLRPAFASAYAHRGLARLNAGDLAGASADFTEALGRGAPETQIYFLRAEARARSGDADGSARDRLEGLRRAPVDAESWVARGLARLAGEPAGALADFEAALRLDPRCRSALQDKAVVLSERLGRAPEAVATLDRAVELYPEFTPARIGRGVLLARLGRREAAHRDAEAARRADPSAATAYRVACIYALTSRSVPADREPALRTLAAAVDREASWVEVARTDADLDPVRETSAFRELLEAPRLRGVPGG